HKRGPSRVDLAANERMELAVLRSRPFRIIQISQQRHLEILDASRLDNLHRESGEHHRSEEALLLRVIIRFDVLDDRAVAFIAGQRNHRRDRYKHHRYRESSEESLFVRHRWLLPRLVRSNKLGRSLLSALC